MHNTREEFEKWYKDTFGDDCFRNILPDDTKLHYTNNDLYDAWQEQQKKIDDLQLKLDIKDDAMRGYQLVIDELEEQLHKLREIIEYQCSLNDC